jgi:hypothetical protein
MHDTLAAFDWLRGQPRFTDLPTAALGSPMNRAMAALAAAFQPTIEVRTELCGLVEFDATSANGS